MNKAILIGKVVRDIDLRQTQTGKQCAMFTLAVQRPKAKGAQRAEADFISCVAWEHNAEFAAKYLQKGSPILVEGRISTRNYEKNGQKVYVTEVIVDRFEFTGPKPQQQSTVADGFGAASAADDIFY